MKTRMVISYLLFPITMWYGVVVWIRNLLFDIGIIKQHTPEITTIGIGNLSFGGTGKTPHVEYLLRLLGDDFECAMLSRGYRRESKGYQVDDGSHSARLLGDEAAMVAHHFPQATVAVGKDRYDAIMRLRKDRPSLQVVLLDDVMQHRFITPSVTIMLTDYNNLFYNDRICPYGNLRESRRGRYRANVIVVTKSPAKLDALQMHNIVDSIRARSYQRIFFSYMRYGELHAETEAAAQQVDSVDNVLCFTGIANAEPLVEHLKERYNVVHMPFSDHHRYSKRDVQEIADAYGRLPEGNNIIVTTDKDMARLYDSPLLSSLQTLPVYSIGIEVAFHNTTQHSFDEMIRGLVKENIYMHHINEKQRNL